MISALLTVYNGERFIKDSIDSILKQTFSDFELIIVDDGSTDNTLSIIKEYIDDRIILVTLDENKGVGAAIKEGLKYCTRKYIAKVDADDIYLNSRFELQYNYLEKNPDVVLVDGLVDFFPDNENVRDSTRYKYLEEVHIHHLNSVIEPEDIHEKLYWFSCVTHSTVMYRRDILEYVTYDERLRIAEDYTVFYKLNDMNFKIHKLPFLLGKIRISDTSTTAVDRLRMFKYTIKLKEKLFINNKNIYIWGTGELGQVTAKYLMEINKEFLGFIDNNVSIVGTYKHNHLVFNKSVLNNDSFIIVASSIGKFDITEELKERGYKHLKDYMVVF